MNDFGNSRWFTLCDNKGISFRQATSGELLTVTIFCVDTVFESFSPLLITITDERILSLFYYFYHATFFIQLYGAAKPQ